MREMLQTMDLTVLLSVVLTAFSLQVCLVWFLARSSYLNHISMLALHRLAQRFDVHRLPLEQHRFEMQRLGYDRCAAYELIDVFENLDRYELPHRFRALLLAISERVQEDEDMLIVVYAD